MPLIRLLATLALLAWHAPAAATQERVLRDLAYGPDPAQVMDVYLPEGGAAGAAVMVMVHGGGWRFGDKAERAVWQDKRARWGRRGYVFVSVNYRLLPEAGPTEQARDVARALALVQDRAPGWGADPRQLVLMGHSAGAHLVALLGADPALAYAEGAGPWRATVALDTAMLDVEGRMRDDPGRIYRDAFGADPALWRAASPRARLGRDTAPFLMVCSSRRRTACPAARDFAGAVRAQGGQASVLPVALSHRDVNAALGLPGPYTEAVDGFLRGLGLP